MNAQIIESETTTERPLIPASGIDRMIELSITSNGNPSQLRELLEVKQIYDAGEAKKAYYSSMSEVQKNIPAIKKRSKNEQTDSMYAKLEAINKELVPVYTANGFGLSFNESPASKERYIRIDVDVYHSAGHLEQKYVELPLDDAGIKGTVNKTGIHAAGSTINYGRRYLTLMVFNIATEDDDDDGQAAGQSQIERLQFRIDRLMIHNETLRERNNLESIAAIKAALAVNDYDAAAEAYCEITDDDKIALSLAWTKGGMFSPQETKQLKEDNDFAAARRSYLEKKHA